MKDFGSLDEAVRVWGDPGKNELAESWYNGSDHMPYVAHFDEVYALVAWNLWRYGPLPPGWRQTGLELILLKRDVNTQEISQVDSVWWHEPDFQVDEDEGRLDTGKWIQEINHIARWDDEHVLVSMDMDRYNDDPPPVGIPYGDDPLAASDYAKIIMVTRKGDSIIVTDEMNLNLAGNSGGATYARGWVQTMDMLALDDRRMVVSEGTQGWAYGYMPQLRLLSRTDDTFAQVATLDDPPVTVEQNSRYGMAVVGEDLVLSLSEAFNEGISVRVVHVDGHTLTGVYSQGPTPLQAIEPPRSNGYVYYQPSTNINSTRKHWAWVDCKNGKIMLVWPRAVGAISSGGYTYMDMRMTAAFWSYQDGRVVKSEEVDLLSYQEMGSSLWWDTVGMISASATDRGDAYVTWTPQNIPGTAFTVAIMEVDTSGDKPALTKTFDYGTFDLGDNDYWTVGMSVSPRGRFGVVLLNREEYGYNAFHDNYWFSKLYAIPLLGELPLLSAEIIDTRSRFAQG